MPTIYEKCGDDSEPVRVVRSVMEQYHGDLVKAGVTVECLFAANEKGEAVKHHGWPCFAKIKVMSLADRAAGSADARIVIDRDKWDGMHANERRALIDHELEHLALSLDANNKVKTDDLDRPKMRCRPHDFELTGFRSVVERHKDASVEVRNVSRFLADETGQLVMQFAQVG